MRVLFGGFPMTGSMIMGIVAAMLVAIIAGFVGSYLSEKDKAIWLSDQWKNYPAKRAALQTGAALCVAVIVAAFLFIGDTLLDHYFATEIAKRSTPTAERK